MLDILSIKGGLVFAVSLRQYGLQDKGDITSSSARSA
ncbi:hydrolase subunit domain protein [Francisella tularensis subsp. holarctica]|nr:hydrolase subunit domain protein [Francisella tularensis subsp. holarctica]AJI65668.1 hydrolase subunit domain protein [Francisella tularensis subsp. holarctica]